MRTFRYPSADEIRALELEARRARSRELGRLFAAGAAALKSIWTAYFTIKGSHHSPRRAVMH